MKRRVERKRRSPSKERKTWMNRYAYGTCLTIYRWRETVREVCVCVIERERVRGAKRGGGGGERAREREEAK